jgi:hypothetical protein
MNPKIALGASKIRLFTNSSKLEKYRVETISKSSGE